MKYYFVYKETNHYGEETGKTINFAFKADSLDELCSNFEDFLKGCGFYLENKHLDFVENEECEDFIDWGNTDAYANALDTTVHSDYYYDYDRNMPLAQGAAQPTLNIDLPDLNTSIDPNNFNYSTMDSRNV